MLRFEKARRSSLLAGFLLVAAVVLWADFAWARAGGGEHFSGGGSSRSSGGGHSSGGHSSGGADLGFMFEVVRLLLQLTFRYPHVMIPIWLFVGFIWYATQRRISELPASDIRALERAERRLPDTDPVIAAITQRDPSFRPQAFTVRAQATFLEIQESWFLRRLESKRHLMSDGLYRRFTTLQRIMALEGRRDALADVVVSTTELASAETTPAYDLLTVRIKARLRDAEVPASMSDDEARAKARSASSESFTELWTFVRSGVATTRADHDLSLGQCPNCGAPFSGGMANTCDHCSAVVNSGRYDWVLTEITQPGEYMRPNRGAQGLAALLETDPNSVSEVLEDRALLLFWKWLEAFATADVARLRKFATPPRAAEVKDRIERMKACGLEPVVRVPAVGGADVLAVELNDGGRDRVHVDIRWSAIASIHPDDTTGRFVKRPRRHVVTMSRRTGETTRTGFSTERCGQCQAPVADNDAIRCEYCDNDLSSGEHDWVLDAIVPFEAWPRPKAGAALSSRALATRNERLRILFLLIAVAKADGVIDPAEKRVLKKCASRWGIRWNEVEPFVESTARLDTEAFELDTESPAEVFEALVELVKADGHVHARERAALERTARHLGIADDELARRLS